MPATRPLMLATAIAMWLLLALILALSSIKMLRACGISLLGYQLSWCEKSASLPTPLDRHQGLLTELGALERQYRALPLCGPGDRQGSLGKGPIPPLATLPRDAGALGNLTNDAPHASQAPPPPLGGGSSPVADAEGGPSAEDARPAPGHNDGDAYGNGSAPPENSQGSAANGGSSSTNSNGAGERQATLSESENVNPHGASCPPTGHQRGGPILLALDHSKSMALPSQMDDLLATELEARMEENTPAGRQARDRYNGYVAQPGIKRLDILKQSVGRTIRGLPPSSTIGLVTFAGCEGVVDAGLFSGNAHDELLQRVEALRPIPATPVAEALRAAFARARVSGNGRIVLVTDGRDTCGGDPCAVALRNGDVRVDVLAMGGGRALSCIAEATGGRLIEAAGATAIDQQLGELLSADGPPCP